MAQALTDFEREREANIKRNKELLAKLGISETVGELVIKKAGEPKQEKPLKRKKDAQERDTNEGEEKVVKAARVVTSTNGPVRRSLRNAGKTVDYNIEQVRASPVPIAVKSGIRKLENDGPLGRESGKRTHDPKTYGSIPGVEVGTWWETRMGCSADAIHAPWVAGISGGKDGAYSVALSGGYPDDVDLGYAFTYTGSGGRDLKGTKNNPKNLRTAPQSSDQSFDNHFNAALKRSSETRKPVRVIRGFKLKSKYAPGEGYRYDGLYRVEKAWLDDGLEGFKVCKFAFKRLDGQPPLPVRGDHESEEESSANDDEDADS